MEPISISRVSSMPGWQRFQRTVAARSFWILAAMMVGLGILHYLTPQIRFLPFRSDPLGRHAVERIIFVLPVASATFAFGHHGGLITLLLACLVMLPRALFISPYPVDAAMETVAVGIVGYLVVWMIDVQEREKELRQEAVMGLRTIHTITTFISGSQDLEQSLDNALGEVLDATKAALGCIYLLDRDTRDLVLAVCRGAAPVSSKMAGFELGSSLIDWLTRSGQPVLINDLAKEPRSATGLSSGKGLHSLLAVPLKSRDTVLGFIYLADPERDRFAEQDLQLLTSISNEIGVAIENARLHHDAARQLRTEQQLNEVAEQITSELELERILPKVLQIAEDLVGADAGVIALYDRQNGRINYPYMHNLPESLMGVTILPGAGLSGRVIDSGHSIMIEDYAAFSDAIPEFVEAGVSSVVGVPLASGERVFGALDLLSLKGTRRFSERDVALLSGIGRQAGIAIDNAQLYENMRYYIQQVTRAQEDERKRIARELHDDTIQDLIVLSRRIEGVIVSGQVSDPAKQRLEALQKLTDGIIYGVRRFSQDLRPSILDDLGLVPALEGLTASLSEGDGIHAELQVRGERRRLTPEGELTLFRIAQEAHNNVKKHAQATRVSTMVEFNDGSVNLTIQDDGILAISRPRANWGWWECMNERACWEAR
jgi:GAF domain-containing protein